MSPNPIPPGKKPASRLPEGMRKFSWRLPEGARKRFGSFSKSRIGWAIVVFAFAIAFLGYDWFRLSALSSYR